MRREKVAAFFSALACAALLIGGCGRANAAKRAKEDDRPVIVVGSDNYPPFNYEDASGLPTGIDVDLATEAFGRLGYRAAFLVIDWEDKKELVECGAIDCIWGSFSIDGREAQYRWTEPYMLSRQVVAVRRDSDIYALSDLAGKRVAVQSTTKPEELFLSHADPRLPALREVFSLQNRELIYPFLSKGYADAIAAHETAILQYMSDYRLEYRILDEPLLTVVFLTAAHSDTVSARQQMATTIRYIQEQCNRYNRIELASETKSLMRVMESVGHIARQMAADGEESAPLSEYAQMGYVSGLIVMDETGFVLSDYHGTGEAPRQLGEYLDSPALLDAALYPEKRYATRFVCADGSMIDLAAVGRRDAPGIVAAYYRTPVEYLDAFRLSIALMLSGYSPETSGTIVVTGGSRVVASNDETLIGGNAEEMAILRQIRQAYSSGELVRASWPEDSFRRYYGMMGCGRNFYVYVYMPEKTVFATTPQSMLFALIFYAVVLAFAKAVRFRTAQSYQERQYRVQKEYAEKLRAANAELSAAVDQADRANAAKTSFLSRMSHDIRTPLNGIIGLLQIDDAHPSDVALLTANREKMKVAANHLLSLINDVLQMSKLESGEITLAHEPLDLNRLLRDILTIVEQRAAEAGVALEYDRRQFERMKPDCVYGSPLHLRQVFLNVYGNCIKYNKVGGSVTTLCQNVGERDGIVTYRWVIRDTGIGMSRAFLAHIFDPFAQEHTDARSVYHGTGLGMAIVKSLIDKMGGSIEVSSREGEGSEFVITLPFEIAEELPEPQQAAWETEAADVRGLRILLAEDNALNAEIVKKLLEDRGAEVEAASDGRQALEAFESHKPDTYAAILMDVMMPNMDGLDATRAIRALDRADAKVIPIIAMTANAFEEDARKCMEAGMNAHLPKPIRIERLVAVIAGFCGARQA